MEGSRENPPAWRRIVGPWTWILGGLLLAFAVAGVVREMRTQTPPTEVLERSDLGRDWVRASLSAKKRLCAEVEDRTGVDESWLRRRLDEVYSGGDPDVLAAPISYTIELVGDASGR